MCSWHMGHVSDFMFPMIDHLSSSCICLHAFSTSVSSPWVFLSTFMGSISRTFFYCALTTCSSQYVARICHRFIAGRLFVPSRGGIILYCFASSLIFITHDRLTLLYSGKFSIRFGHMSYSMSWILSPVVYLPQVWFDLHAEPLADFSGCLGTCGFVYP